MPKDKDGATAERMVRLFTDHLDQAAAIAVTMNVDREMFLGGAAKCFAFWQDCHDAYRKEDHR